MELNYQRLGEGTPVIILHGLYGMSDNWLSIGKKLSGKYEVYLVDLRNHGDSPHSAEHSYEAMVRDLFVFIEHHSLFQPVIIGHSMGGKVAMKFGLKYQDMVKKLVIVDIAPKSYIEKNQQGGLFNHHYIMDSLLNIDLGSSRTRRDVLKSMAEFFPSKRLRQFLLKNLKREKKVNFAWKINIQALKDNLDNIMGGVDIREISEVADELPVLFIKGADSDYIDQGDEPDIKKIFPEFQITEIEDAGHWVHAEQPDALIEQLEKFIANSL
jgi:pimeloyl-ACP methyl ester carboxylesterase